MFQAGGLIAVGQRLAPLSKASTPLPHPGEKLSRNFSVVVTFFGVSVAEWPLLGCPQWHVSVARETLS